MRAEDPVPTMATPPRQLTGIAAAVIGNGLEFYDFTVFAFFAVPIGRAFFPSSDAFVSLLLSVATFGVGFVTRPLGAAMIGAYADRAGRRPALLLTVGLVAVGTAVVALTPPYAVIGGLAPVLVVSARLVQGFALGGDVGPASALLIESAPPHRRGLHGAWQIASQGGSALLAGLVGLALATLLSPAGLEQWGWRVAMLIGLAIVPVGLSLRRAVAETLPHASGPSRAATSLLGDLVANQLRTVMAGLLICMAATVATYTSNYLTTYALTVLHLPPGIALGATAVVGAATLAGAIAGGWLSDRLGRRVLALGSRFLTLAIVYPVFALMNRHPTPTSLYAAAALLSLSNAASGATGVVLIAECFPQRLRSVGLATTYALGISVFGGTTQFVITGLIGVTHDPLAPAWYLIATNVVGFLATFALPETVPLTLRRVRAAGRLDR